MKAYFNATRTPASSVDLTDNYKSWRQLKFKDLSAATRGMVTRWEAVWQLQVRNNCALLEAQSRLGNDADEIVPGVHVGSYDAAVSGRFLHAKKIVNILNMAVECNYAPTIPGTRLFRLGIEDAKMSNVGVFTKAAQVIAQSVNTSSPILIHCAAGVSRSATAVIAYLMIYQRVGWFEAVDILREQRPCVNPHHLMLRTLVRDLGDRFLP